MEIDHSNRETIIRTGNRSNRDFKNCDEIKRKWTRFFVVILYLCTVSLSTLVLSVYYYIFWTPIPKIFVVSLTENDVGASLSDGGFLVVNRKG